MKNFVILTAIGAILAACGGTDVAPERSMAAIYADAYENFNDGDYADAAELFTEAEAEHSTDPYAPDALVMAAYSRYMDDDFSGALIATDRFLRFHPGHRDAPYILYLRGMCYYRQVSDVRREPGMSVFALQQFEQLRERFPTSEYAKNAENKIHILKNYIAGKVMYSARTDMKRENWTSAITKLQSVVQTASETVMTPEALYRLTQCYTAIGLPTQAAGYADMLRKNFPDNQWTKKLDK
ncbi:MAG: outer membrane protein assembly factor BamD [Alphaproteobacteria bacterium]|nr:outer membrane protein assembly factor BamD [Alphaproteobacteria bacterium]